MAKLNTVKVKWDNAEGFALLNEDDFKRGGFEKWEPPEKESAPKEEKAKSKNK